MTVKGQEFPAYDGRGLQGMGLAYATSNRGACHLRGYMVSPEVLGIPVKMEPQATEGKPAMLKAFQDLTAVVDSAGPLPLHHLRLGAGRHPAADPGGLRGRLVARSGCSSSASASGTWSASSTSPPG